jgi:DNA-binding PadR family transcriptional regulator
VPGLHTAIAAGLGERAPQVAGLVADAEAAVPDVGGQLVARLGDDHDRGGRGGSLARQRAQRAAELELDAELVEPAAELLSQRLSELAKAGLIARTVDAGPPVSVSYELTSSGQALMGEQRRPAGQRPDSVAGPGQAERDEHAEGQAGAARQSRCGGPQQAGEQCPAQPAEQRHDVADPAAQRHSDRANHRSRHGPDLAYASSVGGEMNGEPLDKRGEVTPGHADTVKDLGGVNP